MLIQKKNKRTVKASRMAARAAQRRAIRASEEEIEEVEEVADVQVDPEVSDILFEAEDVAELLAEVTGQEVAVTAEDDVVTFEVGEEAYAVEAEGDEEILESTKRPLRDKAPVKASRRVGARKPVRARR